MEEKELEKPTPKKKTHLKISWWLIVVAVIAFGSVAYCISTTNVAKNADTLVKTKPDTVDEIKIKQNLSSMRGDIVRYFEANKTYATWAPTETITKTVKDMGSELKTKLTQDSYMVYATMPSSKLIFCMDNTFTGELKKIAKNSCQ